MHSGIKREMIKRNLYIASDDFPGMIGEEFYF